MGNEAKIEMSFIENDDQAEKSLAENEAENPLEDDDDEQYTDGLDSSEPADDMPDDIDGWIEDDGDPNESDDPVDAPVDEDHMAPDGTTDEEDAGEKKHAAEAPTGDNDSSVKDQLEMTLQAEPSTGSETTDFVGLDDDETADIAPEQKPSKSGKNIPDKKKATGKSEKAAAKTIENSDSPQDKVPLKEFAGESANAPEAQKSATGFSSVNKIISFTPIALIIAGFVLYYNPSLIGLTKAQNPATPAPGKAIEIITPVPQQVTTPSPPSKRDFCIAKIEEAVRLRSEVLEKNGEIYELDLHYRNGIAELADEIYQELKKADTPTFEAAMKNKRIELNMRTIQRRQAYIDELAKPAHWLNSGSEELFYLVRKAQLALQVTDIADGIDLNKHTRHLNAAIQKYRPSPDKLAVDIQQSKVQPLEKIWQQLMEKEPAGGNKEKKAHLALNPKDKVIVNQICSGNFERVAELSNISSRAARCLSRLKGSDLFLNGLMTLSPDAAQQLFQWQGHWICLNGVKNLSPAAAQYLFKWKGDWISLNSLNEFPPELAMYLLKWEGQQLELMGLKSNKNETHQKTLKYLALWETTGGKLFVPGKIRQEMKRLM